MLGLNLFVDPKLLPLLACCFFSKLKTSFTGLPYNAGLLGKSRQLVSLEYYPDESQLSYLRNIGPHSATRSLPNEQTWVDKVGMHFMEFQKVIVTDLNQWLLLFGTHKRGNVFMYK